MATQTERLDAIETRLTELCELVGALVSCVDETLSKLDPILSRYETAASAGSAFRAWKALREANRNGQPVEAGQ